jgi:hypothetical protein
MQLECKLNYDFDLAPDARAFYGIFIARQQKAQVTSGECFMSFMRRIYNFNLASFARNFVLRHALEASISFSSSNNGCFRDILRFNGFIDRNLIHLDSFIHDMCGDFVE